MSRAPTTEEAAAGNLRAELFNGSPETVLPWILDLLRDGKASPEEQRVIAEFLDPAADTTVFATTKRKKVGPSTVKTRQVMAFYMKSFVEKKGLAPKQAEYEAKQKLARRVIDAQESTRRAAWREFRAIFAERPPDDGK